MLAVWMVIGVPDAIANEPVPTLLSGEFEERLMIAGDPETGFLSGYYRDRSCRFFFRGPYKPVALAQRSDLGEAYEVPSWEPSHPDKTFATALYSRARNSYNDQITLEPGPDDANRPQACRWRITIDRAAYVSNAFIGVRVIASTHARIFDVIADTQQARIMPQKNISLRRGTGVWVAKTYGAAWSPAGYVHINWYDPPGTPHGGYVRERDLYPLVSTK